MIFYGYEYRKRIINTTFSAKLHINFDLIFPFGKFFLNGERNYHIFPMNTLIFTHNKQMERTQILKF